MRVAVLGGLGHLGALTVRALRAMPGVTAEAASRSASVRVDLERPETFEALRGFDLVIDLADATRVAPDALVDFCLREGLCLLEATSDAPTMERLHALHRGKSYPGALVLGGGIFTGMSNLLGAAAARAAHPCKALSVGISAGPFSGAGASTVALMVSVLKLPYLHAEGGALVQGPVVSRGPALALPRGSRPSLRSRFAEAAMLFHSTGVPAVDVYFAPYPSLLVYAFLAMPLWLLRSGAFGAFMGAYFTFLRRFLLRSVPSQVQLLAVARGEDGREVRASIVAPDGMGAAGWALAATAEALVAKKESFTGARFVDEVCELEPVLARANALAGSTVMELAGP